MGMSQHSSRKLKLTVTSPSTFPRTNPRLHALTASTHTTCGSFWRSYLPNVMDKPAQRKVFPDRSALLPHGLSSIDLSTVDFRTQDSSPVSRSHSHPWGSLVGVACEQTAVILFTQKINHAIWKRKISWNDEALFVFHLLNWQLILQRLKMT